MTFPLPFPPELRRQVPAGARVLLGLSGGVDSSVALAVLQELGCDVQTVTLKNYCSADGVFGSDDDRSCCSLEAIERARRVAAAAGVPHFVGNVEERFRERVIVPFLATYRRGWTPNPCIACNRDVRFPRLLELADQLGCELVATGHYVRLDRLARPPRLLRGADPVKDQSYFLFALPPRVLERCVFPLGWATKEQVRRAAAALGLATAARPESQDVCFVPPEGRGRLFGPGAARPGPIVDRAGRVLGRHRGLIHYTIGQRRGLGIAADRRLYVVALDADRNRLVVGEREQLAVVTVHCDRLVPPAADWPSAAPAGVRARVRYRQGGLAVAGWRLEGERLVVELAEPAYGVAPGQACVLDRDGVVLGGGRIVAAEALPRRGGVS